MRTNFTSRFLPLLAAAAVLMPCGSAVAADVFPQSWEEGTFESLGWVKTTSGQADCDWSIATYADETSQFPQHLAIPDGCGKRMLKGKTKGVFSGTTRPDNRLVSPQFTVPSPGWLSFMLASNMAANGGANVPEASRALLEVYVSPTGDAADAAFTDTVFSETPVGLNKWKTVNLDLSRYAGKNIRIALRLYCKEPLVKNLVLNQLYIDRMQFADAPSVDVEMVKVEGLFNGTIRRQTIRATVRNNAAEVNQFTISATPEGGATVTETVNRTLAQGETYVHTFASPVELTKTGANSVNVAVSAAGDNFPSNNALTSECYIFPAKSLPFNLSDDPDVASQQLVSTASGTISTPDGWSWMNNHNAWIHTVNTKIAYLHTADAFTVTADPVKVEIEAELTGESADLEFYITRNMSDFGSPVATLKLTKSSPSGVMILSGAEPGDYVMALKVASGKYRDQLVVRNLKISSTKMQPDVAVISVTPSSVVAGTEVPVVATVSNVGAAEAKDVKLTYKCGDKVVTETIAPMAPAAKITHTFATPLTLAAGSHAVSVTAEVASDLDPANNSLSHSIVAYAPRELPWHESFESEAEALLWTNVADGGSGMTWKAIGGYEFDGTHILSLGSSTTAHNTWAISPAINIPASYAGRLSFYYGGANSVGNATIKAYLTRTTDPKKIAAEGKLIATLPTAGSGIAYSSSLLEAAAEGGTYHVAFLACDGGQALLIDDIRLDDTDECAVTGVDVSTSGADYSLEPATISITALNAGRKNLTGVKVAYAAYVTSGGTQERVAYVEESIDSPVAPGEFTHEFVVPLRFSKEGIYTVQAAITCNSDADAKNNVLAAAGPERLKTMQLPALWDMEPGDDLHGFILETTQGQQTWRLGAVNQYAGQVGLVHTSSVRNQTSGDLAILNRVYLPAGSYQLSFFFKTTQGQTGDAYKHSFEILMGDAPERAALTRSLFKAVGVTSADKCHTKVMREFTVDKDGYYWLGVNCLQAGMMGNLCLDNIRIEAPVAAYSVAERSASYTADFGTRADEWQRYDPIKLNAQQWELYTSEDAPAYFELKEFTASDVFYQGSWLQAPALDLAADMDYDVFIDADVEALDADNPLKGTECIKLYQSARDLPSEFTEVGAFDKKGHLAFSSKASGLRYLTLKAHSEGAGIFRLRGFRIVAKGQSGIESIGVETGYTIDGRTLQPADGVNVEVFNLAGIKVAAGSQSIELTPGIYLVRTSGKHVSKVIIK